MASNLSPVPPALNFLVHIHSLYCAFLPLSPSNLWPPFPPSQLDLTWIIIRALQAVGLAHNVKLPTEKAMERLRIVKTPQKASAI